MRPDVSHLPHLRIRDACLVKAGHHLFCSQSAEDLLDLVACDVVGRCDQFSGIRAS